MTAMRNATKRILFTVENSNAMNGVSPNMQIVEVRMWWQNTIFACDIIFGSTALFDIVMIVKSRKQNK